MSALSETHLPSRRNDRRTARNRTEQGAWWTPIWAFFNSPLGLWFLSSVLLSTAVYIYQIWQQDRQQQEMTTQKIENLNLEIAGRVSQFGTWARVNLLHEQNGRYEFQESVNATRIARAIEELAASPHSGEDTDRLYIHEILPEFATRNLISLYAELNLITQKALEEACHCNDNERAALSTVGADSKPPVVLSSVIPKLSNHVDDTRVHEIYVKMIQYRQAEVALLSPAYLLQYHTPDHDTFVRSFEGIFLTDDTKRSGLPSTDCLENLPNGGGCIGYPEPGKSPKAS
jgi:hypothetical protein